jgi:putative transposase
LAFRATFYRWYDLYQAGGPEALDDRHPKPDRVWNRIPDDVRERIIKLALEESALSPRELQARARTVDIAIRAPRTMLEGTSSG